MLEKNSVRVALALYAIFSTYFAIWVSDEWDEWRIPFYAFFCVPLGALYLGLCLFRPGWWQEVPVLYRRMSWTLCMSFLWGVLLFLNAILPVEKVKLNVVDQTDEKQTAIVVARMKGGFGWVYRHRW